MLARRARSSLALKLATPVEFATPERLWKPPTTTSPAAHSGRRGSDDSTLWVAAAGCDGRVRPARRCGIAAADAAFRACTPLPGSTPSFTVTSPATSLPADRWASHTHHALHCQRGSHG